MNHHYLICQNFTRYPNVTRKWCHLQFSQDIVFCKAFINFYPSIYLESNLSKISTAKNL